MNTIEFSVLIYNIKTKSMIPITSRGGIFQEVVDWYKIHTKPIAEFLSVRIMHISFNHDTDKMVISYDPGLDCSEPIGCINDMLSDPDDDGNYLLSIGGDDFVVIGEI